MDVDDEYDHDDVEIADDRSPPSTSNPDPDPNSDPDPDPNPNPNLSLSLTLTLTLTLTRRSKQTDAKRAKGEHADKKRAERNQSLTAQKAEGRL